MKKYPLKLTYIAKPAIWGGSLLSREWGKISNDDNIAETWELSVREKEMAKITNGEAEGMTLAEYISAVGADAVSDTYVSGARFPMLVKLIDAADKLSVQVHPDDIYAKEVENDSGKTEMWYIVDAEEGAEIIYGLADGVDSDGFRRAFESGSLTGAMKHISVKKGESYFIPAGMVHAIGKGILIAEIQQNSDLTYRVYDYDRVGADGKTRELHTEKALSVIRPYTESEVNAIRFSEGENDSLLANNKYFKAYKIPVSGVVQANVSSRSFVSLLCLDGEGYIEASGEKYAIKKGDSFYLPAGMGAYTLGGNLDIIAAEV